jgi:hypothetical protein
MDYLDVLKSSKPLNETVEGMLIKEYNKLAIIVHKLETRIIALEKRLDERKDLDEKPNDGAGMPQKSE